MKGKTENGKAIFERICVACHIVGSKGVDYGPNLSEVAKRLIKQDIIESVIDPSAKVAPKYLTPTWRRRTARLNTGFMVDGNS